MKWLIAILLWFCVAPVGQTSGAFNGSTQYVGSTNLPTIVAPFTMHAWVRARTLTGGQNAISLGSPTANTYASVGWTTFFGSARWYVDVHGDYTAPSVVLAPSTNTLVSVILVVTSATVRHAWIQGTNFWVGNGSSRNPSLTVYSLGCLWWNYGSGLVPFGHAACDVAEYSVWSAALDAGERVALDSGQSPTRVRPQALVVHVPGTSTNFQAAVGPVPVVVGGPTLADHPRTFR